MEHQYSDRIVRLLQLYLLGDITEEERQELEDWCEEAPRNRKLFEQICQEDLFSKERYVYEKIHDTKAFSVFEKRVRKVSSRSIGNWWKYAAVLLFPILVVGSWKLMHETEQVSIVASSVAPIQPGCSQAVLVLDDGRKVFLKEEEEGVISEDKEITVTGEKDRLVYTSSEGKNVDEIRFNELEVPRGGEYKVRLADGTLVYLNSATRMKYPVKFDEKERKVYLSGEAYFEVSKNKEKPFLVQVDDMSVKVYGTEFNVNTYNNIETVLVTGSVSMNQGGKEVLLKPNQKGVFDQVSGKITVADVDVLAYVSWKNGDFIFRNESLNSIMDKLSRWYGLEVLYQDARLQNVRLSGNLKRYKDVRELFVSFEKISDARFKVQGNKVIVSSK